MKHLLIILIIANVYCVCKSDEYLWRGYCLHCKVSPCKGCNGSNQCAECFDGILNRTGCDTCLQSNSMVINGRCTNCSSMNADFIGGFCMCKYPPPGIRHKCCDSVPGVYDDESRCKPCSKELIGCDKCEPPTEDGRLRCLKCLSGYNLLTIGEARICIYNFHIYDSRTVIPQEPKQKPEPEPSLCDSSCKTCLAPGPAGCLTCAADFYFIHDSNIAKCFSSCPPGYRKVESPFKHCENCGSGCFTCTDSIFCIGCLSAGRVIKSQEECILEEDCRNGYSIIPSTPRTCKKCGYGCSTCSVRDYCLTCIHIDDIILNDECIPNNGRYRGFLSSGIAVALFLLTFF